MLANQIGIVMCRVGAAVLIVQTITSLGQLLPGMIFAYGEFHPEILTLGLVVFVPGLTAIGLWVFADRISGGPITAEDSEVAMPLTSVDMIRVGTTLVGITMIATGIIAGVGIEVSDALRQSLGEEYQAMAVSQSSSTSGARASYVVQLFLGVLLVVGRKRMSASLERAKYAATSVSRNDT